MPHPSKISPKDGTLDPDHYPDCHQSMGHVPPLQKISSNTTHNFFSNLAERQTEKQTDRQTNKQIKFGGGKNLTKTQTCQFRQLSCGNVRPAVQLLLLAHSVRFRTSADCCIVAALPERGWLDLLTTTKHWRPMTRPRTDAVLTHRPSNSVSEPSALARPRNHACHTSSFVETSHRRWSVLRGKGVNIQGRVFWDQWKAYEGIRIPI